MPTSYTLVGTPFSTFTRTIALALHYKSVPFSQLETKPHDPAAREHHPFGFLPTLVIHQDSAPDVRLCESQAIARYIDRIASEPTLEDDHNPLPEKMWEFVSICASLGPPYTSEHVQVLMLSPGFHRFEVGVVKVRLGKSDADEDAISAALEPGLEQLRVFIATIELLMAEDGFMCGQKHVTWADFFLYPLVADLEATPEAYILTPRLATWSKLMKLVPAVKATEKGTLADVRKP
jgi:glutathione S-transferase